jgi:hypothetical protein
MTPRLARASTDVGVLLEQLLIVANGGRVIAALLGGYGGVKELFGAGGLRRGGAGQQATVGRKGASISG